MSAVATEPSSGYRTPRGLRRALLAIIALIAALHGRAGDRLAARPRRAPHVDPGRAVRRRPLARDRRRQRRAAHVRAGGRPARARHEAHRRAAHAVARRAAHRRRDAPPLVLVRLGVRQLVRGRLRDPRPRGHARARRRVVRRRPRRAPPLDAAGRARRLVRRHRRDRRDRAGAEAVHELGRHRGEPRAGGHGAGRGVVRRRPPGARAGGRPRRRGRELGRHPRRRARCALPGRDAGGLRRRGRRGAPDVAARARGASPRRPAPATSTSRRARAIASGARAPAR